MTVDHLGRAGPGYPKGKLSIVGAHRPGERAIHIEVRHPTSLRAHMRVSQKQTFKRYKYTQT